MFCDCINHMSSRFYSSRVETSYKNLCVFITELFTWSLSNREFSHTNRIFSVCVCVMKIIIIVYSWYGRSACYRHSRGVLRQRPQGSGGCSRFAVSAFVLGDSLRQYHFYGRSTQMFSFSRAPLWSNECATCIVISCIRFTVHWYDGLQEELRVRGAGLLHSGQQRIYHYKRASRAHRQVLRWNRRDYNGFSGTRQNIQVRWLKTYVTIRIPKGASGVNVLVNFQESNRHRLSRNM